LQRNSFFALICFAISYLRHFLYRDRCLKIFGIQTEIHQREMPSGLKLIILDIRPAAVAVRHKGWTYSSKMR